MKQLKILGILAIALTLGLAGCNKGNEGGDQSQAGQESQPAGECENGKHKWGEKVTIKEPTCTEDGQSQRTCTVCGAKEEPKTIKAAHKWGEWQTVTASTCAVKGTSKRVCSVCQAEETKELDLADHTYAKDASGNDVVTWSQEADCTNAGSGVKTCTVCGHEEAVTSQALGHNFKTDAQGNIEFTWTVAPTCEKAGVGTKHCERCGIDVDATEEEAAALGHDIEAVGGATTPTDGTAAVRLYHCKRCNETYMGFLANEVTNESKDHVYFEPETVSEGQEQGARFKGRPIGNALALDAQGTSVNQQNGECVYCSTETGDFIEYAFRLNAEQAATLATCRLYCDAKPADYLNGTDFWAYGRSNDEWTPGYYIDGGDERFETNTDGTFVMTADHEKAAFDSQPGAEKKDAEGNTVMVKQGKRIEDYRYVLYVDDNVVDFDPDTANPTHGNNTNMTREEFVLPYTFHLHEGLNKIKFVMAGGYRSLFYKCIFRPYVEPTPITVNETSIEVREGKTAPITSSMTGLTYRSSDTSVCTVDQNGVVTGVKAGTATITVSKEGNFKDAKVPVTVLEKEGIITLDIATGVIAPAGGFEEYTSGSSGYWIRNPQKDATLTYTFQSELAGEFDIQLGLRAASNIVLADNIAIKVNDADVAVSGTVPNTNYNARDFIVGQANLVVGENTMVITALESSALYLKTIKLMPHAHVWGDKEEVAASGDGVAYDKYVCSTCGKVKIEVKLVDAMLDSGSENKNDPAGYMKLKSNNQSFSFKFNYDKAATGKIYQRGVMDSWSTNKSRNVFSGGSNGADDFELTVNGTKVDLSAYKSAKFQDVMKGDAQDGNLSPLTDVESGVINLVAGENTVVYKRVASYNLALTHIVFIVG